MIDDFGQELIINFYYSVKRVRLVIRKPRSTRYETFNLHDAIELRDQLNLAIKEMGDELNECK